MLDRPRNKHGRRLEQEKEMYVVEGQEGLISYDATPEPNQRRMFGITHPKEGTQSQQPKA